MSSEENSELSQKVIGPVESIYMKAELELIYLYIKNLNIPDIFSHHCESKKPKNGGEGR
jgi:hypothetical protein